MAVVAGGCESCRRAESAFLSSYLALRLFPTPLWVELDGGWEGGTHCTTCIIHCPAYSVRSSCTLTNTASFSGEHPIVSASFCCRSDCPPPPTCACVVHQRSLWASATQSFHVFGAQGMARDDGMRTVGPTSRNSRIFHTPAPHTHFFSPVSFQFRGFSLAVQDGRAWLRLLEARSSTWGY